MRKTIILAMIVIAAGSVTATAQSLTAPLSGFAGGNENASGLAVLSISGNTVASTILTNGLDGPSAATVRQASDDSLVLDLGVTFTGGAGTGTVDADSTAVSAILAHPGAYYVLVGSSAHPDGAIRGTLLPSSAGGGSGEWIFPVAASAPGAAGTVWKTDLRLVNRGTSQATVSIAYYPASDTAAAGPSATVEHVVPAGSQLTVDDVLAADFGVTSGKGALRVSSDQPLQGSSRIYNDQRSAGLGTLGQQVPAMDPSESLSSGTLPMLSNTSGDPQGFRTNIGWFNPGTTDLTLTFTFIGSDGRVLATATESAPAQALVQKSVTAMASGLDAAGDFYVTFTASPEAGLFVYGSVVDNTSGDAVYVPATR